MKKLNGVIKVKTSVFKKEAFVKFDDKKISLKKIKKALEDAGYMAEIEKSK